MSGNEEKVVAGRPRPTIVKPLAVFVLITLTLWLIAAGSLLLRAEGHARSGEESLREVIDLLDDQELADADFAQIEARISVAAEELTIARDSAESVVVRMLSPLPVVGRQTQSARALIRTTHDVSLALQPILALARTAQDQPGDLDRVAFLESAAAHFLELERVAENADLGPSENLVGQLVDARSELAQELLDLGDRAGEYRTISAGLAGFLSDSRYLLIGANNAEMRIASGMHLSVGELTIADGGFELPGLEASAELFPVEGADVVDEDVAELWGFLMPANDYRKLAYSARFDEYSGPQALELWRAQTGEQLDGVIAVDPFVLDALLSVVGEVTIDGQLFGSGDVLAYLLTEQYAEFDGEVDERRDRLSDLANAVVEQFDTSEWDPLDLLDALRPLVKGRHILAYAESPVQQAVWEQLGVAGALNGDETGVFLMNIGANKLDPFVRLSVDVSSEVTDSGAERVVSYDVTVRNRAPKQGLPRYTVGPWQSLAMESEGTYRGRVAVYMPGSTTSASFADLEVVAFGRDGPVVVAASTTFDVPPGGEERLRFEFSLPASVTEFELVPSARFPVASWTIGPESFNDSSMRLFTLD